MRSMRGPGVIRKYHLSSALGRCCCLGWVIHHGCYILGEPACIARFHHAKVCAVLKELFDVSGLHSDGWFVQGEVLKYLQRVQCKPSFFRQVMETWVEWRHADIGCSERGCNILIRNPSGDCDLRREPELLSLRLDGLPLSSIADQK